jgi:hypothetical protein
MSKQLLGVRVTTRDDGKLQAVDFVPNELEAGSFRVPCIWEGVLVVATVVVTKKDGEVPSVVISFEEET